VSKGFAGVLVVSVRQFLNDLHSSQAGSPVETSLLIRGSDGLLRHWTGSSKLLFCDDSGFSIGLLSAWTAETQFSLVG
jgi:hypothetical protein